MIKLEKTDKENRRSRHGTNQEAKVLVRNFNILCTDMIKPMAE